MLIWTLKSNVESSFSLLNSGPLSSVCSSLFNLYPFLSSEPRACSGSSWACTWTSCTRGSLEHSHLVWFCAVLVFWTGCPLQEQSSGSPPCFFRARISCLGFHLEDPALKITAFAYSNQISQQVEWGGLKLLVIFKGEATSVVISTS